MKEKMEKSTIITIALSGLGGLLLALDFKKSIRLATKNLLRIFGVSLILIASIISTINSEIVQKEKGQFREEVIKKLEKFNNDLKMAKKDISSEKQIRKIEKTEIEFNQWAQDLTEGTKLREIDYEKHLLEVEAKEYRLNSRWKHLYSTTFDYISALVSAYNKNSNEKIEYICENEFPVNIFSKEAKNFKVFIKFDNDYALEIKIDHNCFYSSDGLPCIEISYRHGISMLSIHFNLQTQRVYSKLEGFISRWDDKKYESERLSLEKGGSIENYPDVIRNILKKFFEKKIIDFEEYKLRKSRD